MATAHTLVTTPTEARAIAKDAYIYGFPLVDSYRIQYSYFADRNSPEFKTSWNQIYNNARVYTPDDKAVQTPNSDTPYSFVGADLRAEPIVLTVPAIEKGRYFSLQFIDQYTFNFAYVGSRATGNEGGSFLLAEPRWKGTKPDGMASVIQSETDFVLVVFRTQLLDPADIEKVKGIQAGYRAQTLSTFLGQPAPSAATVNFPKPISAEEEKTSAAFFNLLSFVLQFCPTHPSEVELMERFARIGIGAGQTFDSQALSGEMRTALEGGMADAWQAFAEHKKLLDEGKVTSPMRSARVPISMAAMYPVYFVDADRQPLNGSQRYLLRFAPDQLPPVNAFWSLTLYELPASLLSVNPLNRYLINSPMLPALERDSDGGVTLLVQHESPGQDKESNWLPAPKGSFFTVLRLYWPKPEALDGRWTAPPLKRM